MAIFVNTQAAVTQPQQQSKSPFTSPQKCATGEPALDMAPLAAVLCGKEPRLVEYMTKSLLPRIQIVHACITTEAAETEIPALLRGEAIKPVSGYGTNTRGEGQPRTDISFIIVGGGYQPAELDKIKAVSDAVKPVPFFAADRAKNPAAPGPPPPEIIKQRILAKVDEADDGTGSWAPVIHRF